MRSFKDHLQKRKESELEKKLRWLDPVICGCKSCKSPLWVITVDKWMDEHKVVPCDGIPPYSEYWKDMQPIKTECPVCGGSYMDAVALGNGTFSAVPYILPK